MTNKSYKAFLITDPTPWMDQLIHGCKVMAAKCGGTSVEYTVRSILQGVKNPNVAIFAACEEGAPEILVGWAAMIYVHDSLEPWVEIWALWCRPGAGRAMRDLGRPIVEEWARFRGAKKILAILTRNPRSYLKAFYEPIGFEQIGIVIERKL